MSHQSIIATCLSWIGIVGGALTVFSNLETLIKLSDWSRWITSHWNEWMTAFWGSYLGLANVTTDPGIVLVDLPFVTSLVLIAIGSHVANNGKTISSRRAFYSLLSGALILLVLYAIVAILEANGSESTGPEATGGEFAETMGFTFAFAIIWLVAFLMMSHWPYKLAVASASAVAILLFVLMVASGLFENDNEYSNAELAAEFLLIVVAMSFVVFVAKPAPFTRYLWILVLCIMTLAGLNAVSNFRFDLSPPSAALSYSVTSSWQGATSPSALSETRNTSRFECVTEAATEFLALQQPRRAFFL